jgi:triphosphoribosyl-dephospho-CoA synthase
MHALTARARQSWQIRGSGAPSLAEHERHSKEADKKFCAAVGRLAVRSLYSELKLYPKPGLVSMVDSGSHEDMDSGTFMRSLFSLRYYFVRIARAGFDDAPFDFLKLLGMKAEVRMLHATSGINTHRGAIFSIGMLCAAAGRCRAKSLPLTPETIRSALLASWGQALKEHGCNAELQSHGQHVAASYAVGGAREEMALGLPSVFGMALPTLQATLDAGRGERAARIDALFSLMAHLNDTNVYYRRGIAGADLVRTCAQHFLAHGGTAHPNWEAAALEYHRRFVENKLSPGGAADLLAAACFIHDITSHLIKLKIEEVS